VIYFLGRESYVLVLWLTCNLGTAAMIGGGTDVSAQRLVYKRMLSQGDLLRVVYVTPEKVQQLYKGRSSVVNLRAGP
jgi:hypothetical protein